jgi:hypothetical protein
MRSMSAASKCADVTARRNSSKASSRLALSVRNEPEAWSRLALKPSWIALASTRSWKLFESSSPAPSSSSPVAMVATPGLSAGSWLAPPRNEKSKAISGTEGSCTSHASMPPGLTMRSIVVAWAARGMASGAISAAAIDMTAGRRLRAGGLIPLRGHAFTSASPWKEVP